MTRNITTKSIISESLDIGKIVYDRSHKKKKEKEDSDSADIMTISFPTGHSLSCFHPYVTGYKPIAILTTAKCGCELWAKFCFPNNAWQSPKFQNKLFREHKMICDKHFKSTSFGKEEGLAKFLVQEKDKMGDNLADVDIGAIKNEYDNEITMSEHDFEATSPQLISTTENVVEMFNSSKNINSERPPPLKVISEESDEINNSSKIKMMNNWDNEPPEISQEDFDETYNEWFSQTSKNERNDDCQLYGKLITKKLRTYSVYERNLITYKIDGLLIENPPGFDTSSEPITTKTLKKPTSNPKQSNKKAPSTSPTIEGTCIINSYMFTSPSSKKRKKLKKDTLPQEVQKSTLIEVPFTSSKVTSTSFPPCSPVKIVSNTPPHTAVMSSISKQPVQVIHTISNQPVKLTGRSLQGKSVQYQHIKVSSSNPSNLVKNTSSIAHKPVKVSSIPSWPPSLQPTSMSTSVPSHLPLEITIPETKLVPVSQSKFVTSSSHPKGKIVIMKSKSTKFVASSQPPILITVPSLPSAGNFPMSTQCDMNSLEQLSSIAATLASEAQKYHKSMDTEEMEMTDDMDVVAHEVVLSASSNSPLQNIVETAQKKPCIEDEYIFI